MVDEDIGKMYDQVTAYLAAKQAYYADPENIDTEFTDHLDFELTGVVDLIQRQIARLPTLGEAATIKGYRDMRSATSEYDMRRMSRSDYWADAAIEEQDNIDKWNFNKKTVSLHMNGKDAGN